MLFACFGASAAEVPPGEYATQPGFGELSVGERNGARVFRLFAMGANGHMCELEGTIEGAVAIAGDGAGRCEIDIAVAGDRLGLKSRSVEACRNFCGARASFDADYFRLPAGCLAAARERRKGDYMARYKAGRHADALAGMDALQGECGKFLDWLDKDRLANDRAIALYHLGRRQDCLAALDDTLAGSVEDEGALEEKFWPGPADWEMYLPIARATWHNRSLCKGKGAASE